MALGILAMSAGLDGQELLSALLLGLSMLTLIVMAPAVLRGSHSRLEQAYVWLTWTAACGVIADHLGRPVWPVACLLAALAVFGWVRGELLFLRLLAAWPGGWRHWQVEGSWLLAVVATQSVSILASALGGRGWAALAALLWLTGVLLYAVLITLILRRLLGREIGVESHTPDYWISMGGLAITAVAALDLDGVLSGYARDLFMSLGVAALVAAALWVPYLLAVEVMLIRIGSFQRAYDALRWSTVFPLGMLSVAIYELARASGASNLVVFAQGLFWAGVAVAVLNVAMLVLRNE